MKISIIITYHGEEGYIRDCLDSLEGQIFKDFETIVVGSGIEFPADLIHEYDSLNIRTLYVKEENVAAARNAGLKEAAGEYVTFIDADDYLDEEFLERLYTCASEKSYDMVFGKARYTWYKRDIYLASDIEKSDKEEAEDEPTEQDKETIDEDSLYYHFDIVDGDSDEVIHKKVMDAAARYLILKRKNLAGITVLGNIYSKKFLDDNNITYDESLKYFCDLPFLAEVLGKDPSLYGDKQAVYVKRRHNDPIHSPSLLQSIGKDDFNYRIKAYEKAVEKLEKGSSVRVAYERKLINYFSGTVAPAMKKNEEKVWRKKRAPKMKELFDEFVPASTADSKLFRRRLVAAMRNNDIEKVCKISGRRNIHNWIVAIIKGPGRIRRIKEYFYKHKYAAQPMMDDTILFESFFGKSYSDSPKYIFEKINEMYPGKYNCVWILDKKTDLPYPAKQIKRFSTAYYKYLARSKYIVFNSRQPKNFIKREGNVFLETWHGTPLKKLVYDMDEVVSASPSYKKTFYIQSRSWDYLVAANGFSDEVFRRAFDYDKVMLKYGYPRNDILHAKNKSQIAAKIRDKVGIPQDKKVILYAPTWRDDEYYEQGKYKFDLKLDLRKMRKELGDDYAVILRTHYFIADNLDTTGLEGFAYNLSKYDDIAELYLISDILITDYSSVFFDYANLKRPMLFFTYDLDKYRDVLRGFYIDMEKELPGPLVFTNEEIIDSIKNINGVLEKYADIYDVFYERFCGWEDGHASENCIKEVFK